MVIGINIPNTQGIGVGWCGFMWVIVGWNGGLHVGRRGLGFRDGVLWRVPWSEGEGLEVVEVENELDNRVLVFREGSR